MALGIEQNSIAPGLIMQSGKMLSDNIRDIGKQVQSSIYEINTRKDLAAMAEEIQGGAAIPQSDSFAQDAVALGFRHPLAIQDPRGQMALNVLGKSHGEWQQQKLATARLEGQLPLIEARNKSTLAQIAARTAGQMDVSSANNQARKDLEDQRQLNRITNQEARTAGQLEVLEARQNAPMTPAQREAVAARKNSERRARIKEQVDSVERDIRALEQSLRSTDKMSPLPGEKEEWQKQVIKLRDQRNKLLEQFNAPPTVEEIQVEPELGAVPPSAVLPEPGTVAPPMADGAELVVVINPQGKRTRIRKSQLESALQNGYSQP